MPPQNQSTNNDINSNLFIIIIIIILILLWLIGKCICKKSRAYSRKENMAIDSNSGLYYGNSPITIDPKRGIKYIALNKNNIIDVPNSKTAMRHLFDDKEYKCNSLDNTPEESDQKSSIMQLKKNNMLKVVNKQPASLSATRLLSKDGRKK